MMHNDTIVALATAAGAGAIAVIRISGKEAWQITAKRFRPMGKKEVLAQKSHTVHLGDIVNGDTPLDQVLVSLFKGPHSYTGEDVVEISCHGSPYIQQQILQLFLNSGCRMAGAGEFTLRAFLNGKMDLSQAEAVADVIASDSEASHRTAMAQMRGGFGNEIKALREKLLHFASLIELELDFSEEDVEFANRGQFEQLLATTATVLKSLMDSFALGNVIKNGVPVAIIGEPNVGKSTLLNALLNEERAIVSAIPGTTRDTVEDQISLGGIVFRFIDTAGIRDTTDVIEKIGIERTHEKVAKAAVVLYLFEAKNASAISFGTLQTSYSDKQLLFVANKIDAVTEREKEQLLKNQYAITPIAAKTNEGLDALKRRLIELVAHQQPNAEDTVVTNGRHYGALQNALTEVKKVQQGLEEGLTGDLLAIDVRQALYHLGEISGAVTTDDLLGNIFSKFCIGK